MLNGLPGHAKFNLHGFWDAAWRASFDDASGCVVLDPTLSGSGVHDPQKVRSLAEALEQLPPPAGADLEPHFDQWARESNDIARDFVYRELTATESPKYCRLSSGYVTKANRIAPGSVLVLAAYRLAALLNAYAGRGGAASGPAFRLIPRGTCFFLVMP